jgi:hypothetical protein
MEKAFDTLKVYMRLADETRRACYQRTTRVLALNIAHYTSRFGELPMEEQLDFLHMTELREERVEGLSRFRPTD